MLDADNISVTKDNVVDYLDLYTFWRLSGVSADQFGDMSSRIYQASSQENLLGRYANATVFGLSLSGEQSIDISDWRANTGYLSYNESRGTEDVKPYYNATTQVIVWFWYVINIILTFTQGFR
jgi:hypothetical protein